MKKRMLAVLLCLSMVGAIGCGKKAVVEPEDTEETVMESEWKSEYFNTVFGWQAEHGMDMTVGYTLMDVNADSVPELILYGDGESFSDVDIYSFYHGKERHMTKCDFDGVPSSDYYLATGGKEEGLSFFPKTGMICVATPYSKSFYQMISGCFFEKIRYEVVDDKYNLTYVNEKGKVKTFENKSTDGKDAENLFWELADKYDFKKLYQMNREEEKDTFSEKLSYMDMVQELGGDLDDQSGNKAYATFLQQFMMDETNYFFANLDRKEITERLEYTIFDLDDDGANELLIRDNGNEYGNVYVYRPASFWLDGYVGQIHAYDFDSMRMMFDDGMGYLHICEIQDGAMVEVECYEHQQYEFNGGFMHKYYHQDASGNRVELTEEQFRKAPFQSWTMDNFGWNKMTGVNIANLRK